MGYVSLNLVANLDAFVMLQYKKLFRDGDDVNTLYGFAGGLFRFE
ncbi:MAG: hypothetical protein R3C68_01260 [Myxococcota bacterium]